MTEIKCPFCQQELKQDYTGVMYCCNKDCKKSADWFGSFVLWKKLIDTKKKLDICEGALEEYKDWFNKSQERLKIAVDALKKIDDTRSVVKENLYASYGKSLNSGIVFCWTTPDEIHNTLKQINKKEGK